MPDLALREKQIQQNYRPIIAVHKWFARRPGTLFRGLLLSEFSERPLREVYYKANDLSGRHVADPFMGGGTPILEANRVGCNVIGFDINPCLIGLSNRKSNILTWMIIRIQPSYLSCYQGMDKKNLDKETNGKQLSNN